MVLWLVVLECDGGSLAPEWAEKAEKAEKARTAKGGLKYIPLGYTLFMKYFDPVLSTPNVKTLRSMFKDNATGGRITSLSGRNVRILTVI